MILYMDDELKVSKVFVPGKLPDYTYNPRADLNLESSLADYVEEAGSILTVAGPTKTGKSVLLRRVVENPVWVDGQGIESVEELWRRIGDSLGIYTGVEVGASSGSSGGGSLSATGGFSPILSANTTVEYQAAEGLDRRMTVMRPIGVVVREALQSTLRSLVIDDFHFIDRPVQREIVRALKPFVLEGVPILLVSISHRVQDVVTAEPDMTGRVYSLQVKFWSDEELAVIANKGFQSLNVEDSDGSITRRLAENSYGSPHLMQKFCREICKLNNIRVKQNQKPQLQAPSDWEEFFKRQVEGASADWFQRLLRGPQERGSKRTQWPVGRAQTLDGYGVTLRAIANTGPKLNLTKDEIKAAVDKEVVGGGPAAHQTTRVLQHMSKIAATRVNAPTPTEDELDAIEEPDAVPDVQPVLEYMENGPNSVLHIADPFFAFYLRWGGDQHLQSAEVPGHEVVDAED